MLTGRCHCGTIRYALKGEPIWSSLCHCADCRRHFCADCGTGHFYCNAVHLPGIADVQIATLDDAGQLAPTMQVQAAERIGWMERAHELPAFARYPARE